MKKIAIVSNGYAWFPVEPGPSRFYYIANIFCDEGWDVEIITTSFQHFNKQPRNRKLIKEQGYPFKITMIDTPSYKKNIDIRRVYSNKVLEKNIIKYLKNRINQYDAVYCSIPANNIAASVSKICKANNVPFVVDIEDLWPEAMSMVLKNNKLRNVLLHKMNKDAETAYSNAAGVVGTSEDYTDRAFRKRERNIPNYTVYVGCDLKQFDDGVSQFCDEISKNDSEIWVTYAGSIGTSYDIKNLIDAGIKAYGVNNNIRIQILGTGPMKDELVEYSKNASATFVKFWGYMKYPQMAAFLAKSDILVNSFVKGAPQSIVNKIGDYLAAGKPMLNTLENPVFCSLVDKYRFGLNVEAGRADILSEAILSLCNDNAKLTEFGKNARDLAEIRFDRSVAYKEIVKLVNSTLGECENE